MSYPRNANDTLSYSLSGAQKFALETSDTALMMEVAKCSQARNDASKFKAKLVGCDARIEALQARIREELLVQEGGQAELSALKANATMSIDAFMNYVDENYA